MAEPPQDNNWFVRHRWWILLAFGAVGALFTQFQHIEPNAKRMAEIVAGLLKAAPLKTPPPAIAEQPLKKEEPPRPTVACLKSGTEMKTQLRSLGGDAWEPAFNRHFKNRTTCLTLPLTAIIDGRLAFAVAEEPGLLRRGVNWVYYVTPKNRGELKRFKPGMRLLIEGDLERYADTAPDRPDEIYVARARVSEAKEPDGLVTGTLP